MRSSLPQHEARLAQLPSKIEFDAGRHVADLSTPLNAIRTIETDLPNLAPEKAQQLEEAMRRCSFASMEFSLLAIKIAYMAIQGSLRGRFWRRSKL